MVNLLPLEQVAVRLADEGVPLRAIARATGTPSDELRLSLRAAKANGTLVDLPKEDWPPGFPRDQRALQLSRMVVEDREAVSLAMVQVFHLTPTEAGILMTLLQSSTVPKTRINMAIRTIDVHICRLRQHLEPFGITVTTLWGHGYQLSAEARHKIMDLLLSHVQEKLV